MSDLVIPNQLIRDAPAVAEFILSGERARIRKEIADHGALALLYGEGIAQAVFGVGLLMRRRWPL